MSARVVDVLAHTLTREAGGCVDAGTTVSWLGPGPCAGNTSPGNEHFHLLIDYVRRRHPYWDASNGTDHFLVSGPPACSARALSPRRALAAWLHAAPVGRLARHLSAFCPAVVSAPLVSTPPNCYSQWTVTDRGACYLQGDAQSAIKVGRPNRPHPAWLGSAHVLSLGWRTRAEALQAALSYPITPTHRPLCSWSTLA